MLYFAALRGSRVEKKAILFKIGPWLLKFQKRLVCLNFSALRSCVAHCVAECVAECCRVLQGHCNVATRFHKTPQVLCGELLSSLARQTLSRCWVQAHNTEPCLDQTTFASLCSLAVHLVLFHGLVLPIVYQAAIKISKQTTPYFHIVQVLALVFQIL